MASQVQSSPETKREENHGLPALMMKCRFHDKNRPLPTMLLLSWPEDIKCKFFGRPVKGSGN